MNKLKSNIYKIDNFPSKFNVQLIGSHVFPSILGVIMTITMYSIGIGVFFTQGFDLFQRKKPLMNRDREYVFSPVPKNISEITPLSFELLDTTGKYQNINLQDSDLVNVEVFYFSVNRKREEVFSRRDLAFEKCGNDKKYEERFNSLERNFTDILNKNNFKNHYCLKEMDALLGGTFQDDFYGNLCIKINPCKNNTSSKICKSEEMIKEFLSSEIFFELYYIDSNIESTNFNIPFASNFASYYIKLGYSSQITTKMNFIESEIKTDVGLIFESFETKSRFSYENMREQFNVRTQEQAFIEFYLNNADGKYHITRTYIKVQDVSAIVGGIVKFCSLVGSFFVTFLNKYDIFNLMIDIFKNQLKRQSATKGSFKQNNYINELKEQGQQIAKYDIKKEGIQSMVNNDNSKNPVLSHIDLKELDIDMLRVSILDQVKFLICCNNSKLKKVNHVNKKLNLIIDYSDLVIEKEMNKENKKIWNEEKVK